MNRQVMRAAGLLLAFLLVACSPGDGATSSTTSSTPGSSTTAAQQTTTTTEAPAAVELRVIRSDAAIDVLDPHATNRFSSRTVLAHIYDALIGRNPETMALEPELAASWNWITDTQLELTLRDDVVFTNGEELNAEVVVWNFERQRNPETGPNLAARLAAVDTVEATGEYTVLITLTRTEPGLLDILTRLQVMPLEYASNADESQIATEPIGSGRYILENWDTATSTVTLVRNEDYWGTPGTYEKITIRWLSETATIQSELLSDGADIVDGIGVDAFELVENSGVARIESIPILQTNDCMLDALGRSGENPFQSKEVRQAVNMAVDWDGIITAFFGDRAIRLATPVNPFQWGFDPSVEPFPYDPDEARRLLNEAGYGDGFDLTLRWFGSDTNRELSVAIAEYWRQVGINAQLENIPDAQIGPTIQGGEAGPAMCLRSSTHVGIFDAGYAWGFFSGSALSYAGDEELQAMIQAANAEVRDEARRRQLLSDLQKYARDEALALYGFAAEAIRGVAQGVDWSPSADGLDRYYLARPS